ncbi:hypothetical protein GLAREA_09284 [Glarea lozoyensis ATCC 20868]|uniref:CHAT domain-containing protein n=1 Tax=Glarea lozoyensis (strain ATCC 20868 / MF5171) TaxID=1116229 RepID=S3DYV7_GLAL2|nr:uncharacterized protein GLAREA_09284 [Glarea lozoyensis ATCC 20868]EPE37121.1 hypothetical protein GLAREA_09284 [Glarea lozoyensis ATCC 20868]
MSTSDPLTIAPSESSSDGTIPVIEQIEALLSPASPASNPSSTRSQKIQVVQTLLETVDLGPRKPQILELLAARCYEQYVAVNEWAALESAIDYYGELIRDTAEDDLATSSRLGEAYARCMQNRFMRGRKEKDLGQAISFAAESVERTRAAGVDSTVLADRLGTLWLCLFTKVHQLDDSTTEDFDRMIQSAEEADTVARAHPSDISKVVEAKSNLGLAYQIKWDQRRDLESLATSVALGREVLDQLPKDADTDARIAALSNLSFRLQRVYLCYVVDEELPTGMESLDGETLLDDALEHLSESALLHGERTLSVPENILTFVMYIRNFPVSYRGAMLGRCANVLRIGVKIIKDYCSVASQEDQRDCLSTFYGISRYATSAALQSGETPYQALQLLEEGRTVALTLQEEIADADTITLHDESLADEYSEALHTFRASFTNQVSFHERKSGMERLAKLQDRIRQIPGILGGPERLSERLLLEMAQDRDIVVVSLTDLRSDAILITKAGLRVVPLPSLDEWQLSEDSWEIQTGLATEEDQEEVFHDLHANLSKLLRDLWRNLVNPVLRDLGHLQTLSKSDSWPRIVWIPTGILCLYPIHAAGLGLHKEANAMNRVISSYASSLSSLLRLHENEGRGASLDGPTKVAIMAMPETVDRQPLDLSLQEAAAITRAFPDSELLVNRTTEDVLEVIARQPQIVHFTCHGEVDYDQPLLSKLLTRDWQTSPLTVAQLQVLNIERSRLAFLSACFTANAGVENMQDENNHLAGALHRAGFPSIVGSLWYVGEEAALEVTRRFYEELAKEEQEWPEHVAKALHFAILDFRETTRTAGNKMRGDPVSWAPFSYFGG